MSNPRENDDQFNVTRLDKSPSEKKSDQLQLINRATADQIKLLAAKAAEEDKVIYNAVRDLKSKKMLKENNMRVIPGTEAFNPMVPNLASGGTRKRARKTGKKRARKTGKKRARKTGKKRTRKTGKKRTRKTGRKTGKLSK